MSKTRTNPFQNIFHLGEKEKKSVTNMEPGINVNNTGYTQKNGAVSKVNKKFISHLTWAQPTPSAAATVAAADGVRCARVR
jgi:hypothetical protein